jgi:endoglucanase
MDLWTDEKALDAFAFQWGQFAKRYKGIPSQRVSFDLLNEPAHVSEEAYTRVVKRLVQAIRAEDPQRLVIADGLNWGRDPVHSLVDLKIAQSTRGYDPMQITHYKANWVHGSDTWPEPAWPLATGGKGPTDKDSLRKDRIEPWKKLQQKGVGVHVGEWGAFNKTPHKVALAWMRDVLELWQEAGWGWAMWNLHGGFGVLDSYRADVAYEDFHGNKLDREMLTLLQKY